MQAVQRTSPMTASFLMVAVMAIIVGIPWLVSLYLFPTYWIAQQYLEMAVALGVCIITGLMLVPLWFRVLPPAEDPVATESDRQESGAT